ncbi:MAG TPA: alkaline phosphatase D family protein [Bryobacteraceae bacterium]|nr:alkaline phosphatase D family protein [Bryobacteraceae bacterium]
MQHRREFLFRAGTLLTALWNTPVHSWPAPKFSSYPFALGIASGDPAPDGMVLWTRLAPKPLEGGGMPDVAVSVEWRVAEDEGMKKVVKKGTKMAVPALAHSVHVEVAGLRPDRWYWYQFRVAGEVSPIGRTRTAPSAASMPDKLRYSFASCQHWETGYYTAYEHMAAENPDLVIHLGDYIYEGAPRPANPRQHNSQEIVTLSDYRNRHALYKTDKALQRMHAVAPWIVTWDDHEVDNNYAGDTPEDKQTRQQLLERRANAYQAYYENMPLRAAAAPKGSSMLLYRGLGWGRLADFAVLDTRQYRTDQPCGDGRKEPCKETYDPAATLLGPEQHSWLESRLAGSQAAWNILAQQVLVAKIDFKRGDGELLSMDQWSGYEACRDRLLRYYRDKRIANPVVITGDIHSNWASDLRVDWKNEKSAPVAVELTGTSITSSGDGLDAMKGVEDVYAENPHLKWHGARRGYVSCVLTPGQMRADFRTVPYVSKPGAPVVTSRSFVSEAGRPGLQNA